MAFTQVGTTNIIDFCTPMKKDEFCPSMEENRVFHITEEPVSYIAPLLKFNTLGDFNVYSAEYGGTEYSGDIKFHGPFHPLNQTRKDTFVAHLQNASIIPGVFCILNSQNQIVFPNTYLDASQKEFWYYSDRTDLMITRRRIHSKEKIEIEYFINSDLPTIHINEPCILLSSQSSSNIYHWLIESIPRLWILDYWPELRNAKFIVHNLNDHKLAILSEKFSIPLENLISLDSAAKYTFTSLIYPSALCDIANVPKKFDFLRHLFGVPKQKNAIKAEKSRRYYITRRDTQLGRGVINEKEIILMLNQLGIEELVMSEHTLDELAQIFSNADILIGPMGSGLINMIYMPPKSAVIEMSTRSWGGLFWAMGSGCGHRYYVIGSEWDQYLSNRNKPFTFGMPDAMEFDIEKLKLVVERAISEST